MPKSIAKHDRNKPRKPAANFPLTAHPSGRWCKKLRGRVYYFGKLDDWKAAVERFNREWPYIVAGRTPPAEGTEGCTLRELCNQFLAAKQRRIESGELARQSFADYHDTCTKLIDFFGRERLVDDLAPGDFERFRTKLAEQYSVSTLRNEINRCRIVFRFAFTERLIDRPVHFGQSFSKPAAKLLREARNKAGARMFEAVELRTIINAADPVMRAMIYLGLNCGFGNTDISMLPHSAVNLDTGWIIFPRPKTAIMRRIPLWPETAEALKIAIAKRPNPKLAEHADLCFVTVQGNPWVRVTNSKSTPNKVVTVNSVTGHFARLLRGLGINGERGFYTLRHNFETIGGDSRDQIAVNAIMGHADQSMAAHYRERIDDARLKAVTDHVRAWLWPKALRRKAR
jgi:integrase